MSFLFGSSPELKHVEAATSDLLLGPDWGANLEICDAIKGSQDAGKNYLKAILKRIQHKNPNVAKLGLELLGSTVKNCSKQYHVTLHKQENLNELVKVAKKQGRNAEIQDMVYSLIATWGEAFSKDPSLPNFFNTYQKLLSEGVRFPQKDPTRDVPLQTPARHVPIHVPSNPSEATPEDAEKHPYTWVSPEYIAKVKDELREVVNYVSILRDMCIAQETPEEASANEVMANLYRHLKQMQGRLMHLIVEIEHEYLVDLCVQVNDHVTEARNWYKAVVRGKPYELTEMTIPKGLNDDDIPADAAGSGEEKKGDDEQNTSTTGTGATTDILNIGDMEGQEEEDDGFDALINERHNENTTAAAVGAEEKEDNADAFDEFDTLARRDEKPAEKDPEKELEDLLGLDSSAPASQNTAASDPEKELAELLA